MLTECRFSFSSVVEERPQYPSNSNSSRDLSPWRNNRIIKHYSPWCFQKDLRRKGEDGEISVEKKQKMKEIQQKDGHHQKSQDAVLLAALKACTKQKDLHEGSRLHAYIIRGGLLEKNVYAGSSLVNMYAKCGALEKAQETFDELVIRDAVPWNALIAGYVHHNHGVEAMDCFDQMQTEGFFPSGVTFTCILKAIARLGALEKGQKLHAQIVREHLLEKDTVVANGLVDMYCKCGALGKAREVFDELRVRDVVSWNTLIAGYAQEELAEETLSCFEQMELGGFSPDAITLTCVLKACGRIGALGKGEEIHAHIVRERLLEKDMYLGTALVDMYAKCGALEKAEEAFSKLQAQNDISWNALISGYSQLDCGGKALKCFERMQLQGLFPSAGTFSCVLKVCGSLRALNKGQEIHAHIVRECLFGDSEVQASTALLDMYAKCGALAEAQEVFDELPSRNVVSWNALIAGYVQHEHGEEEALSCFERMQNEGFSPDAITFACVLKACGSIGAPYKGQKLHSRVARHGLLETGMVVGNALVDMYANCGMLKEAQDFFDTLHSQDVVSWSALMVGYAQVGTDQIVFNLFSNMIKEGIEPDSVAITIVLNAYSHNGLLDTGQKHFESISKSYGMMPTLEHYACMVDLLSRAGHLNMATVVIGEMPLSVTLMLWHTFLGACQRWGNTKLGRWAFKHAVQCDEMHDAAYVCVSNM